MRWFSRFDVLSLGLWAVMWVVSFVAWSHVPEEIPTHWNLSGEVDGVSSRTFGLLFVPLLATMVVGLLTVFVRAVWVKDSENVDAGSRSVRRGILALFAVIHLSLVMAALGGAFDMGRVLMTAIGVFFAYLGLVMPKLPRNRWIGVRTKASLATESNWKTANRTAGWAFMFAGIIIVLGAFLPPVAQLALFVVSVLAAATVSVLSVARKPISPTSEV